MFILMFTRKNKSSDAIFLMGTFDTYEEAQLKMATEFDDRLQKGWDLEFSRMWESQAFLSTYDMDDIVRMHILDTNKPVGFDNNDFLDFADCAMRAGIV